MLIVQVDGTPGVGTRGTAGVGVVVRALNGRVLHWHGTQVAATTSNEAEYQALLVGLELVLRHYGPLPIRCVTDSQVVVEQLLGRARVRAGPLHALHGRAQRLIRQFPSVEFVRVGRGWNRLADAVAWDARNGRRGFMRAVGNARTKHEERRNGQAE